MRDSSLPFEELTSRYSGVKVLWDTRHNLSRMDNRHSTDKTAREIALWAVGTIGGEILVRVFEPEIQAVALAIRHLLGL